MCVCTCMCICDMQREYLHDEHKYDAQTCVEKRRHTRTHPTRARAHVYRYMYFILVNKSVNILLYSYVLYAIVSSMQNLIRK